MRGLALLAIGAVLVAVVAAAAWRVQAPQTTPQPGPSSAIEECNLPGSDVKTGAIDVSWQVAVRLDSPQETAILFTSGSNLLQCEANRAPDGTYWSATMGGGSFLPQNGAALTYETGGTSLAGITYAYQLVIGQVPAGTASIQLVTTDGERHDATIGNGWYMAWATTTGPHDPVVRIDAFDSTGKVIASLADSSGLRPSTSRAPTRP